MSLLDRPLTRRAAVGAAAAIAAMPAFRIFARQESSPAAEEEGGGLPPLPEGATLVASGLWNPGNLAFGDDGTLYIAETGVAGGGGEGAGPPAMATPLPDGSLPSGFPPLVPPQVSALAPDGTQSVLSTEAGGVGIGVFDGVVYVANGGSSVGAGMSPQPAENTVSAIDLATGETRLVASLGPYEVDNNPDGTDINPNLYGLTVTSAGTIYVTDAGGNTIYQVDPATGDFSLFAVVPNLTDLTGATPTAEELAIQPGPRQPVPTAIVSDSSDQLHVTLLSEFWAGPSLLTYSLDGAYTVGAATLSMIVSAALGPDGHLYVTQLTEDFSGDMPAPGNVLRVYGDGTSEVVAGGLFFPHGIAFDAEGNLYVAVNSIISPPDVPLGQVVRFDGIAG